MGLNPQVSLRTTGTFNMTRAMLSEATSLKTSSNRISRKQSALSPALHDVNLYWGANLCPMLASQYLKSVTITKSRFIELMQTLFAVAAFPLRTYRYAKTLVNYVCACASKLSRKQRNARSTSSRSTARLYGAK